MTRKSRTVKNAHTDEASHLIRLSDGQHPAGNLFFRLERLNRMPVTDEEAATLLQNPALTPGPCSMTFDELTGYIAGILRNTPDGTGRADVWLQTGDAGQEPEVKRGSAVWTGPRRVTGDAQHARWQTLADDLKS